ncbi:hypothetical protein B0A55_08245 [Friedmanniomyces simplex]|uniref:Cytochrome P450 n=1 Tax=Friedmanniomyces simplex TaxID=329884 RepID=A0A4U0WUJ1_9PEZI|nr:hypothetical protein B0A55_08245 [Friedmanniomyces simplex]
MEFCLALLSVATMLYAFYRLRFTQHADLPLRLYDTVVSIIGFGVLNMASDLLLDYSKNEIESSSSLALPMRCVAQLCKITSLAAVCVTSAYFGVHVAMTLHSEAAPDAKEPLSSTRTKPTINDSPAVDLPGEQVLNEMQMSEARGCPRSTSAKDLPATAKQTSSDMRTSAAAECLSILLEMLWIYGPREALKEVLPQKKVDDRKDNPLNSLLPGDETMWRVVLRCFTEVTARGHPHGSEWCDIMQAFVETPTDGQLLHISGIQTSTSASQIGKETLRLYPPTRRVYREYRTTAGEVKTVAADIEACHRDPKTWAPDPLRFRPERWNGMEQRDLEDPIFMPFSARPYSCPLKRRVPSYMPFGLGMIALLVGTLVKQTIGEWKMVGKLPGIDELLDTERKAYSEL